MLDRLLLLNYQRHAQEVQAGLVAEQGSKHGKASKTSKSSKLSKASQSSVTTPDEPADDALGQASLF